MVKNSSLTLLVVLLISSLTPASMQAADSSSFWSNPAVAGVAVGVVAGASASYINYNKGSKSNTKANEQQPQCSDHRFYVGFGGNCWWDNFLPKVVVGVRSEKK